MKGKRVEIILGTRYVWADDRMGTLVEIDTSKPLAPYRIVLDKSGVSVWVCGLEFSVIEESQPAADNELEQLLRDVHARAMASPPERQREIKAVLGAMAKDSWEEDGWIDGR